VLEDVEVAEVGVALLQLQVLRPRRLLQRPMVLLLPLLPQVRLPAVEAVPGEVAQVAVEMGLRLPRVALLLFRLMLPRRLLQRDEEAVEDAEVAVELLPPT